MEYTNAIIILFQFCWWTRNYTFSEIHNNKNLYVVKVIMIVGNIHCICTLILSSSKPLSDNNDQWCSMLLANLDNVCDYSI